MPRSKDMSTRPVNNNAFIDQSITKQVAYRLYLRQQCWSWDNRNLLPQANKNRFQVNYQTKKGMHAI